MFRSYLNFAKTARELVHRELFAKDLHRTLEMPEGVVVPGTLDAIVNGISASYVRNIDTAAWKCYQSWHIVLLFQHGD